MVYIGIDPGKNGGFAVISTDELSPSSVTVRPMDEKSFVEDMRFISEVFSTRYEIRCCLEKVGAMPGQGVTSMFNFGVSFGWLQGMMAALGISYELVRPQKWKREFSITGDKNSSIAVCKRLFPDVSLYRSDRCRKEDDGLAEALLMAEYARRKL